MGQPPDLYFLVDTGADTTNLPLVMAGILGYANTDLEAVQIVGVDGQAQSWQPKVKPPDVEIRIGGWWHKLPAIAFVERLPAPLLGRDLLFQAFRQIRMELGDMEFK